MKVSLATTTVRCTFIQIMKIFVKDTFVQMDFHPKWFHSKISCKSPSNGPPPNHPLRRTPLQRTSLRSRFFFLLPPKFRPLLSWEVIAWICGGGSWPLWSSCEPPGGLQAAGATQNDLNCNFCKTTTLQPQQPRQRQLEQQLGVYPLNRCTRRTSGCWQPDDLSRPFGRLW